MVCVRKSEVNGLTFLEMANLAGLSTLDID